MKKVILFVFFTLIGIGYSSYSISSETISEERYNKVCKWWIFNPPECKKRIEKSGKKIITTKESDKRETVYDKDCKWGIFNPPKCKGKDKRFKESRNIGQIQKTDSETELNLFTGMFDFSDGKQSSGLVGLEHQNQNLYRNSFLGKLTPITGGFITEKNAMYFYTGAQAEYDMGLITITPSFAPGYYSSGNGKDLGHALEFKSEVQLSLNLSDSTEFGMSYNHISNASLGDKNPGANSYMLNFLKQF